MAREPSAARIGERFAQAIRVGADQLNRRPRTILHGDLGDQEIIVSAAGPRRTIDVVDWGDALAGDPAYDFERFMAGGPVGDPRRSVMLRPVLDAAGQPPTPAWMVHLYRAHNQLRNADWARLYADDWIEDSLSMVDQELDRAERHYRGS
ncbi:phosphotransferase [Kribbella sp. NPDC050124]|uniref:phosphotransferase n=1 Tax=Kribbella sp. NPDC050124 TaxID=3364114 RepID=UPI0037B4D840